MSLFSSIGSLFTDATGALTAGAGSLFGGLVSGAAGLIGGEQQNSAAAAAANAQDQFQNSERLATYPDTVQSLEAAGLNPMLAYSQGGLPVPAGAQASVVNPLSQGVSSAQAGASTGQDIMMANLQKSLVAAQAHQADASALNSLAAAKSTSAGIPNTQAENSLGRAFNRVAESMSSSAASAGSFSDYLFGGPSRPGGSFTGDLGSIGSSVGQFLKGPYPGDPDY